MGKTIGETLREGRLHQRLSIAECAKRTHISPRYLEALEEERWNDLPSESHRMGFLRLYARFLGVYSEDIIQLYRQSQQPTPVEKSVDAPQKLPKREAERLAGVTSWQRVSLLFILALVSLWGFYHGFRRYFPEKHADLSWIKFRPRPAAPRLIAQKRDHAVQRIRARADADSWLRVSANQQLIFEGILPAGSSKEWSGPGPFRIKIGNVNAVALHWNDQLVDLRGSMRGSVADLLLPPAVDQDKAN